MDDPHAIQVAREGPSSHQIQPFRAVFGRSYRSLYGDEVRVSEVSLV